VYQFDELTQDRCSQQRTAIVCLPLLVQHVDSDDYVCYTRTIDWILLVRRRVNLLSTQVEYVISRPRRKRKIDGVGSAVKVAEIMI